MDAMTAIQTCFEKYGDFNGRARRSEFWWFWAFLMVASFLITFVDDLIGTPIVGGLFTLATISPILAAGARRLHDTDRSGWWQALSLPPLVIGFLTVAVGGPKFIVLAAVAAAIGAVALQIFLMTRDGMPVANRFGPPSK